MPAMSRRDMRQHPIGTGPFKFEEYRRNQDIKLNRNPDYWKPGRPYLDGAAGRPGSLGNLSSARRDLLAAGGQGLTMMSNSRYNGWRFEDVWLDR
jgi:ABC-type transport system substrate-binding protein